MTKIKFKKLSPYLIAFFLILLFLFLRFYKITDSLFFFNDIGRDFVVFWRWQTTGKPPLLGPQNSALPFNQSAVYFYLLYPFYLIFNGSEHATIIAASLIYVLTFLLGIFFLRKDKKLQNSLLTLFFLVTIHPQFIIQNRYVWNPTFVGPSLMVAFYSLLILKKHFFEKKNLKSPSAWVLSFALALATAFSYSALPAMLAFLIVAYVLFKKDFWPLFLKVSAATALVNLPTLVFELRHNFLLTNMLLYREKLAQPAKGLLDKIANLQQYLFNLPGIYFYLLLIFLLYLIFQYFKKTKKAIESPLSLAISLFLLTLGITLLTPFGIQTHYIFGILSLLLIILAFLLLHSRLAIFAFLLLTAFWLKPDQIEKYFVRAPHTVAETRLCSQQFCLQYPQAMFVAIQSDIHPYHNATEWQYLLPKNGCLLKDLVNETEEADYLAMIVEQSHYEHGKTAFNELTIFGPSEEVATFVCQENLEIHLLKKL